MIRSLFISQQLCFLEGPCQKHFRNPNIPPQPDFSSPHACWLLWVHHFPGSSWSPVWKLPLHRELSVPIDMVLLQGWSSGRWVVLSDMLYTTDKSLATSYASSSWINSSWSWRPDIFHLSEQFWNLFCQYCSLVRLRKLNFYFLF